MNVPLRSDGQNWERRVAQSINQISGGYPYLYVETLPAIGDVKNGFTCYDMATDKVYTAAAGVWQGHW